MKIGKFEGSELLYQDEVHGSLLIMADRVIDLIYLKYLKAAVSYYKETRVETYPFARDAIREAVFNALIHCNWADNVPVQIRIEEDVMFVSNCSMLPFGWIAKTLLGSHTSKPYNPDIARVFYRAGYIESWGRGIQKICDACKNLGAEEPEYIVHGEDIMVKFRAIESARVTEKVTENLKDDEKKVVEILRKNPYATYSDIADILKISRKTASLKIKALKEKDIIVRVGASKNGYWKFRE